MNLIRRVETREISNMDVHFVNDVALWLFDLSLDQAPIAASQSKKESLRTNETFA